MKKRLSKKSVASSGREGAVYAVGASNNEWSLTALRTYKIARSFMKLGDEMEKARMHSLADTIEKNLPYLPWHCTVPTLQNRALLRED